MFKLLRSGLAIVLLLTLLPSGRLLGQTAIAPTDWSGTIPNANTPTSFTTFPGSTSPAGGRLTASQWNRGSGISYTSASGRYNSNNWTTGSSTLATVFANNDYVLCSLTNNSTTQLKITGLSIPTGQASGTGPNTFGLMYKIGSGTATAFSASTSSGPSPSFTSSGVYLCAGQTITFYLCGWGGSGAGGTWSFNVGPRLTAQWVTNVSVTDTSNTPVTEGSALNLTSTVSDGISPFTYAWTGPSSFSSTLANPTISSAAMSNAGNYSVTATDAWTCRSAVDVTPVVITPGTLCSGTPATPVASAAVSSFCGSGSTSISTAGGTAASSLTYSWESSDDSSSWTPISGATSTTYTTPTITVTKYYRLVTTCTVSGSTSTSNGARVTINPIPSVTVTPAGGNVCAGGTGLSMTATGADSYTWLPTTSLSATTGDVVTANPTVTRVYSVTGTSLGCSAIRTVTVTYNALPTINVTPAGGNVCAGGTPLAMTASGGATYEWAPVEGLSATTGTSVSAYPSATTTYTITGTSAAGCVNTRTVTVTVDAAIAMSVTPTGGNYCSGGTPISMTASGSSTYEWSPATGLSSSTGTTVAASPSTTTEYTITGTSTTGCIATRTVTVTYNTTPTVTVTPAGGGVCSGGTGLSMTAEGATTYTWLPITSLSATTGATVVANPTVTRIYSITGTEGFCSAIGTVTVTYNVSPTISVSPTSAIACAGGSGTSITASGGITYSWAPAEGLSATTGATVTANPTVTTTYTVTGFNAAGCTGIRTVTVTYNPDATVTVTPRLFTRCAGSPANTLTASGLTTYTWAPSTGLSATTGTSVTVTGTVSAVYTVTGTATGGCTGTDTVRINYSPLSYGVPTASIAASPGTSVCTGTAVTYSVAGTTLGGTAPTYQWRVGGVPVSGATDNSYTFVPVNGNVVTVVMGTDYLCASSPTVTSTGLTMTVPTTTPTTPITGLSTVAASLFNRTITISLANATSGGTWSTTNTYNATVSSGGVVTGKVAGIDTVLYTVSNACGSSTLEKEITVSSNDCSIYAAPTFTNGPSAYMHFNTISATGTRISSNISVVSGSSTIRWIDNSADMGITASVGSTVNINFNAMNRFGHRTSVWVDWNNDGNFQNAIPISEMMGSEHTIAAAGGTTGTSNGTVSFTVPEFCPGTAIPVTKGTYLHMRVFAVEPGDNSFTPPCSGGTGASAYGQAYEFYMYVRPKEITVTPSSLDFGVVSAGSVSSARTYTITATGLNAASGSITITPPSLYSVSSNGTTFSTSPITVAYSANTAGDVITITPSVIYVKYSPVSGDTTTGIITNTGGGATANDTVTGSGNTSPYFVLTPNSINFGTVNRYSVPLVRSLLFNGYFLTATGNIVVHSPDPHFAVSTDSVTFFTDSVSFANTSATQSQRVYIKLLTDDLGVYSGNISFGGGGIGTYPVDSVIGVIADSCISPVNQPTLAGSLTDSVTSTGVKLTFVPDGMAPTGYLVVRSEAPLTGVPSNGVIYSSGDAVGTGVAVGYYTTPPIRINTLSPNTRYHFTVFPYNGYPSCTGGPLYLTTAPLADSIATCIAAPASSTAGSVTSSGFTVSYSSVSGASGYSIAIATDSVFASPVSGSPFSSGTASYAATGLNMNTRYYYKVSATGGACNSDYTTVHNVTTNCSNPTITLSAVNPIICFADDTTITASGAGAGATYIWLPARGLTLSSGGAVVAAVPAVTTVYTVTGTNVYGCSGTTATTVTVNGITSGLTITRALDTICSGSRVITVSGTDTILNENFNDNIATDGWAVSLSGTAGVIWSQRNDGYNIHLSNVYSRDNSKFMASNGSLGTLSTTTTTYLTSPAFSLAGLSAATLKWDDWYNNDGPYDLIRRVEISTNGGASWSAIGSGTPVDPLTDGASGGSQYLNERTFTIPASYLIPANTNVRIRFAYSINGYAYGVAVDNVLITGTPLSSSYTWSPATSLSATTGASVTATPATTTAYSVRLKNCPVGEATIRVNALPGFAGGSLSLSPSTACPGTPVTFNYSGSDTGTGTRVSYNWSGPDGYATTGTSLTHIFTPASGLASGTYYLSATYPGFGCTSAPIVSGTLTVNSAFTYSVTGGVACSSTGVTVGLSGSDTGVNYQLYRNGTSIGSAVSGTGSSLSFGPFTTPGVYTITGSNGVCTQVMRDSSVVFDTVTRYSITGGGVVGAPGCTTTGLVLGLDGSDPGITYQLYRNGSSYLSSVAGTGDTISFNSGTPVTLTGTYLVTGAVGACNDTMNARSVIYSTLSSAHTVTGGNGCTSPGITLGLGTSDAGISYQPYINNVATGAPLTGTGSSLSFGVFTQAGQYTVKASVGGACLVTMTGNSNVYSFPSFTATPDSGAICAAPGISLSVVPAVGGALTTLVQSFDSAIAPYGWTTDSTTSVNVGWRPTTGSSYSYLGTTVTGTNKFYVVNDVAGFIATANLVSPAFSTVGMAADTLSFNYFNHRGTGDAAYAEISINGGSSYTTLWTAPQNWTTNGTYATGSNNVKLSLNSYLNNSNVKIRFRFAKTSTGSSFVFAVDNVVIKGNPLTSAYTWAPAASLSASTGTSVTAIPASSTTYSVSIGSCIVAQPFVRVDSLPLAGVVTVSDSDVCTGASVVLSQVTGATGPSGAVMESYAWSGPDGYSNSALAEAVSSATVTSTTTAASGTYSLVVTYNEPGCISLPVVTPSLDVSPTPVSYSVTGGGVYCTGAGSAISLSGSDTGVQYQLYNGSSATGSPVAGTGAAISFGSYTAGTYSVVATSTSGCINNMNDTVTNTDGITGITPGGSPSVCLPSTTAPVSYTAPVGSPNTYNIVWSTAGHDAGFSDVSAASLSSSISVPLADTFGVYPMVMTVSNGMCTSPSYSVTVTIYEHPDAAITSATAPCSGYSSNIIFTGTPGATVSYLVDSGSMLNATLTGGTFSLPTGAITTPHHYTLVDAHNVVCSTPIDTVIAISPINMQWIGGAAGAVSDWTNAANWTCGFIPSATDDVFIPAGSTYAPVVNTAVLALARSLNISHDATLAVNGSGSIHVKETLRNSGDILGTGSVVLDGTSSQLISGKGRVANLELSNSSGASIDTSSKLIIGGSLTITSGTLNTSDSLVLYSDSIATARVAPIVSGSINGAAKVMQYIPGGRRAYRFWSHPFSTYVPMADIQDDIDITGAGGAANGFTTTGSNAPSAFWYNPLFANSAIGSDPGWRAFTSTYDTYDTNRLHPHQGIRVFVRGRKGDGLSYATYYTIYPVTVSMSGSLNQGRQVVVMSKGSGASQDFNMVGNPYASPVDIGTVAHNAKVAGSMVGGAIYVWNPYVGAAGYFQAIPVNTMSATPYFMQANTSFQIRTAHHNDSLIFNESNKGNNPTTSLLRNLSSNVSLSIYDTNYHLWDNTTIQFAEGTTAADDNDNDALKMTNPDLNFYSISTDSHKLAIDVRPFENGTVIPLGFTSNYANDYLVEAEYATLPQGVELFLHDKLIDTIVPMLNGSVYRFALGSKAAEQGDKRFELLLKSSNESTQNNTVFSVDLSPNPATSDVIVSYKASAIDEVSLSVTDMSGVCVYTVESGKKQSGTINVPLEGFASGIYLLELKHGNTKAVRRLVKE